MKKVKKIKMRKNDFVFSIIVIFMLGVIIGTYISPVKEVVVEKRVLSPVTIPENGGVEVQIPALDSNGNGVMGKLVTHVREGSGLVLVNINNVFAQPDTQQSGRIAAKAASDYTGIDLSNIDIIYNVIVNASVIEGPSAGASMAISVVFALENRTIDSGVVITGSIREDGTIAPVGAIAAKARAAKENGATRFLVPANQSVDSEVTREKKCETKEENGFTVESCTIRYETSPVNIGMSLGIEVIEVSTLAEAVGYF